MKINFKKLVFIFVIFFLSLFIFAEDERLYSDANSNVQILEKIDKYRNFSDDGFSFKYYIDADAEMDVYVKSGDEKSVVIQYKAPKKYLRRRIFVDGSSFWMLDSNMASSIKISASQMMSGDASSGDITNLTFSKLYDLINIEESEDKGLKLFLDIKDSKSGNYPHIILYVDKDIYKPKMAELYSRTNTLLKTVRYTGFESIDGKEMLTAFEITNEMTKSKTNIRLTNYSEKTLNNRFFSKEGLRLLK